jgi:hypothetical protein
VKKLLGVSILLIFVGARGATNTIPPLIIKGVMDTNTSAERWTPWSCWWLRPTTNSAHGQGAQGEVDTNRISETRNLPEGETNIVKDSVQSVLDGGPNNGINADYQASLILGRPIGRPNVGIGQQSLQVGMPAGQLAPNNMQMGPGNTQLGGPSLGVAVPRKVTADAVKPEGGPGSAKP